MNCRDGGRFPPKLRLLKLVSVPLWRKFIGPLAALEPGQSHLQTLVIYKLGFSQDYYIFTLILLIKIVLCSKFP